LRACGSISHRPPSFWTIADKEKAQDRRSLVCPACLDLLDELILVVYPILVSGGEQLFKAGDSLNHLHLASSGTTRTGALILTYQPIWG
jgi:hypothetical protein